MEPFFSNMIHKFDRSLIIKFLTNIINVLNIEYLYMIYTQFV